MEKGFVCILCSAILPLFFSCSVKDDGQEIAAAPEISFSVPGMDVGVEGGMFEVGYNVENGTDGGILSPSAEGTDWIGDMRASDGILTFNVGANGSGESRTAVLTLVYSWDGGADTASVEIRQEAGNLRVMDYMYCSYDGLAGPGVTQWTVRLSDTPDFAEYYRISFMIPMDDGELDYSDLRLPEGSYSTPRTLVQSGTAYVTEGGESSISFAEAEVAVAHTEAGYRLTCGFLTVTKEEISVVYEGSCDVEDNSSASTIGSDVDTELDAHVAVAYYWGDMNNAGTSNWYVLIDPESGTGEGLQLDFYIDGSKTFEDGFPVGTFRPSSSYGAGTFLYGFVLGGYLQGTWYLLFNDSGLVGYAPMSDGVITIDRDGEEYSISIDCTDDCHSDPNSLKIKWSGTLELVDKT